MFCGFQNNAFQSNAFQILYGGTAPPPTPIESRGGFDEQYYKKYRQHLEDLERVTRTKEVSRIREIAEEIQDLGVETPELDKLSAEPEITGKLKLRAIDYNALEKEIDLIREYLNTINHYNLLIEQELDDETAFFLMMQ